MIDELPASSGFVFGGDNVCTQATAMLRQDFNNAIMEHLKMKYIDTIARC